MDRFLFPPWVNTFTVMVLGGVAAGALYVGALLAYGTWPDVMNVGYSPEQPVPFSHKLHAGELQMDCRYCHNTVERAAHAAVPSTNICANCHSAAVDGVAPKTSVHTTSIKLAPIHESQVTGEPVLWERVHDLGDYVYFNHSIHLARGVSCVTCHGRIDKMETVHQDKSLSMSWCIDCHRNPAPHQRDPELVTELDWVPDIDPEEYGKQMQAEHGWPERASTNCSTCHR